MARQDVEFPAREDYPLAPEEFPQPRPETEYRPPDVRAEDSPPPGSDYANPAEDMEFSPPGSGGAEELTPRSGKRRLRRLLFAAAALVLLGLLFSVRRGEAVPAALISAPQTPLGTAAPDNPAPVDTPASELPVPAYTSGSDVPLPEQQAESEPLGREPVIDTDFFCFSHEHHGRVRLSNTDALHSVRVNVTETQLDLPVYEHYLSDEEVAAGSFELPILSTGDLYLENREAYDSAHAWPEYEMTVTAWYENEAGDGEDTLRITHEADFEMGIGLSYLRPTYDWYEFIPPDSFCVQPYDETTEIRYVIDDPDAVTDPTVFSVDLSWNGRHAAPEDYEEITDRREYTLIHSDGTETPEVSYTKVLVLRRPEWMPEEATLHVHIVQRLASTGELWVRDYDFDYPIRYEWES